MKIPGEGRIKLKLSQFSGTRRKKEFIKFITSDKFQNFLKDHVNKRTVEVELVTFFQTSSFPDMMLSILSFIHVAGLPVKWTLYTDDAFSEELLNYFSQLPFVEIRNWDEHISEGKKKIYSKKWQLRKFAAYAGHSLKGTTIYVDSDVIFYPLFNKYLADLGQYNWYLPEPPEAENIDHRLEESFDYKKIMYTVNAGFLIVNIPLCWSLGLEYLNSCSECKESHYFLDQSALNLMFYHDKAAKVLDPRVFHATADDHFSFLPLKTKGFAIRHYVGLIRHKMWQSGWKIFLNK